MPNKKAAYELTHIVFYLSDYGAKTLQLSDAAVASLEYVGLLAYLDQDVDLLAEACVALRFAGETPSDIWEKLLTDECSRFDIRNSPEGPKTDSYHEYLVTSWWAEITGHDGFRGGLTDGGIEITRRQPEKGPLREISEMLFHLGPARSSDWEHMRTFLAAKLEDRQSDILEGASQSSARFGQFFEQFSRVSE